MHASPSRRGFAAIALALALALPAAAGASPIAGGSWSAPTVAGLDWASHAWSWLRALWPGEGCGSDPDGQRCGTNAIRAQEGCGSDPSGQQCGTKAVRPQAGCGSDPSGQHCGTSAVRPLEGCGSDPDGHHCSGNARGPTRVRAGASRTSGATEARSRGGHR